MKVEKREKQVVVTPPPTFDITGLTQKEAALLQAITSQSVVIVGAVRLRNRLIQDHRQEAITMMHDLNVALHEATTAGAVINYDTARDPGDETEDKPKAYKVVNPAPLSVLIAAKAAGTLAGVVEVDVDQLRGWSLRAKELEGRA